MPPLLLFDWPLLQALPPPPLYTELLCRNSIVGTVWQEQSPVAEKQIMEQQWVRWVERHSFNLQYKGCSELWASFQFCWYPLFRTVGVSQQGNPIFNWEKGKKLALPPKLVLCQAQCRWAAGLTTLAYMMWEQGGDQGSFTTTCPEEWERKLPSPASSLFSTTSGFSRVFRVWLSRHT